MFFRWGHISFCVFKYIHVCFLNAPVSEPPTLCITFHTLELAMPDTWGNQRQLGHQFAGS